MDNTEQMELLIRILNLEANEPEHIHLYKGDGDLWYAYEHSAFLLAHFFPFSKSYLKKMNSTITLACTEIKFSMPVEWFKKGECLIIRRYSHYNESEYLKFYQTLKTTFPDPIQIAD